MEEKSPCKANIQSWPSGPTRRLAGGSQQSTGTSLEVANSKKWGSLHGDLCMLFTMQKHLLDMSLLSCSLCKALLEGLADMSSIPQLSSPDSNQYAAMAIAMCVLELHLVVPGLHNVYQACQASMHSHGLGCKRTSTLRSQLDA